MSGLAPLLGADYDTAIDREYIVIFKSEVSEHVVKRHKEMVLEMLAKYNDTSMLAVTTDTTSVAPEFHVTTDSELRKTSVASEFHVTTASVVPSELVMTAVEHYVRPDNTITSVMPAVKPPTQSASETSDCRIIYEWNMSKDFRGYAGVFNYQHMEYIRGLEEVEYVEQNQEMDTSSQEQKSAPWGIQRTTKRSLNELDSTYYYNPKAGDGVTIFVIDSGVDADHPKFGGRVTKGDSILKTPPGDSLGHGTHVAGIAIADTYGLARSANLIDVRVFDEKNKPDTVKLIVGINYVKKNLAKKKVVNISLEISASASMGNEGKQTKLRAINEAVNNLVKSGAHVVVAAGNNDKNADTVFPASAELAITVAASDIEDKRFEHGDKKSNYGPCVDIIAPGANIQSTLPNDKVGYDSGTSMAAPHVSGVIATILSLTDEYDDPEVMKNHLKEISSKGKINGFPPVPATDNNLLYYACAHGRQPMS